jgi:DNA-binding TFAR19-related protein (PDSD5 family)
MTDQEIEAIRRQKMATLKGAREAFRRSAGESSRNSMGSLMAGRRKRLETAVREADADLRLYNSEHPRNRPL